MSGEKTFVFQDGIIVATLRGTMDTEIWSEFFRRALIFSTIHRVRAVLIDLRLTEVSAKTFDIYRLPTTLEYTLFSRLHRLAFLVEDNGREPEFIESVFRDNGFTAKAFTEYGAARSWLAGV